MLLKLKDNIDNIKSEINRDYYGLKKYYKQIAAKYIFVSTR